MKDKKCDHNFITEYNEFYFKGERGRIYIDVVCEFCGEQKTEEYILEEEAIDPNTADHPARKLAIAIIEQIIEPKVGKGINGKAYYDLEDKLTNLILKYK